MIARAIHSLFAGALLVAGPPALLAQSHIPTRATARDLADMREPVQVFLVMGQSNTLEMGKVRGGEGSLEHAVRSEGLYPFLLDDAGGWATRRDVRSVHVMGSGGAERSRKPIGRAAIPAIVWRPLNPKEPAQ